MCILFTVYSLLLTPDELTMCDLITTYTQHKVVAQAATLEPHEATLEPHATTLEPSITTLEPSITTLKPAI